jgi:hypothetical protein
LGWDSLLPERLDLSARGGTKPSAAVGLELGQESAPLQPRAGAWITPRCWDAGGAGQRSGVKTVPCGTQKWIMDDERAFTCTLRQPLLRPPLLLPTLAQFFKQERPNMPQSQGTRFTADPLTFIVRHQLWDGNVEDHSDQGVSIDVAADVGGKQTALLRFNCFDIERSYTYGPENPELTTAGRVGGGMGVHCRMDPITDGNPISWTIQILGKKLPKMLERAGYKEIAEATDLASVCRVLPDVEACARDTFLSKRNTVKHNRGTDIFEAGNIRFGLEMRRQRNGDGGLAIHVLGDVGGSKGKAYVEETELLAFDCFWNGAHYHYGPRNKNHRINWDMTIVEDPLEWTFEQLENRKLGAMIERAGYPGIAADLDLDKVASVLPALKKRAFAMYEEGERLTGHKGLPLEFTPNLAAE